MNLREARRRRGWTQIQIAEESDLTAGTIRRIETGKGTPAFGTVYNICSALELLPNEVSDITRPEYSPPELANMWKLTWRHVVLGENVRNKDGTGLAKEFGVGRSIAFKWVRFILDHLPTVHRPPWAQSDMDWLYERGGGG